MFPADNADGEAFRDGSMNQGDSAFRVACTTDDKFDELVILLI